MIFASKIAAPLTCIIHISLRTGVMPATWKHARVSPIYKTGDKAECSNYRPISVFCGISKVIERHVHDALYICLTRHSLLFAALAGFMPGHSCETALLRMTFGQQPLIAVTAMVSYCWTFQIVPRYVNKLCIDTSMTFGTLLEYTSLVMFGIGPSHI